MIRPFALLCACGLLSNVYAAEESGDAAIEEAEAESAKVIEMRETDAQNPDSRFKTKDHQVRRGRLKVEGHVFAPRIGFYYEHELTGEHPLLDLRLDLNISDDLKLRIGQHKILYNRAHVDSSGKQQFVERSIATYAFTLDRQIGVTAARRYLDGTTLENWLMLGINKGTGKGSLGECAWPLHAFLQFRRRSA